MWIAEALKVTVGHSWHASVKRAGQEPTGTLPDLHSRQTTSSSVAYLLGVLGHYTYHTSHIQYHRLFCCAKFHNCTLSLLHFLLSVLQFMKENIMMRRFGINLNKFGLGVVGPMPIFWYIYDQTIITY